MSLRALISPQSVAIVGASSDPAKVGYAVLNNILSGGFQGDTYPVNPKAGEILGKKCFSSVADIPGNLDLAIIIVKREIVAAALRDCIQKSVQAVIVISAGFAESDPEGKKLQSEIAQMTAQANITLMGPNCLGLINPWHKLNASFGQALGEPGAIAIISQSGALVTAIQDIAATNKIGFSLLASIGNKAVIDEVHFLEYLKTDEHTAVIAAYLEDIHRGQEFMRIAERVAKVKPIVILKAGRTQSGAKAASSHTGSLAGIDAAYDCAFERTGVIRAESIEHLFDVSIALAYQPLPAGGRMAVVTNAGGPGIMMTDALEMAGLQMAILDADTGKRLRALLPAAASIRNPVDVLGDATADLYAKASEVLLAGESVDGLIVILTPQKMTDDKAIARAIAVTAKRFSKPVIGGQVDFNRGAARAREGKPIIALPSTAKGGKISRIVPKLTEGAGVVTTRGDVHYVVTEYGIAYLFGKSIRERVLAMAQVAHPDFRNEILREAKHRRYIYADQKELLPGAVQYPKDLETARVLLDGTKLFLRPIKPTDENLLRDMLYACSERSIAFRFFRPIHSFPHRFIQEFTNVDYSRDMAMIALVKDTGGEQIVGVGRYYMNQTTNRAEVSFLVRDAWQAKGIGSFLLEMVTQIAKKRGIAGVDANVLVSNASMLSVFYNSSYKISTKRQDDVVQLAFDLKE